jgi:hypothetical protein
MKTMNALFTLAKLLFILLLLPACEASQDEKDELLKNQDKWLALGWDTYEFNFQQIIMLPPPFSGKLLVRVYENKVERVLWQGKDVPDALLDTVPTLSELFERLQLNLEQGPASFNVTYDNGYGYPTDVFIDRDIYIADKVLDMTISNAVRLRCRITNRGRNERQDLACRERAP